MTQAEKVAGDLRDAQAAVTGSAVSQTSALN